MIEGRHKRNHRNPKIANMIAIKQKDLGELNKIVVFYNPPK